jgi:hypothetical protein
MGQHFSEQELALRHELATNFPRYAETCLKIRSKLGDVQPFRLNRSQTHLHERLEKQLKQKGKIRALVLKGRQIGVSTYIGARQYWKVTHNFGKRAFVLTHLDAASDNLFDMTKRFHEHCPSILKPQTRASNAKELSFGKLDSGYKVATAGSAEIGRSETIQYFHGSEVAFWPHAQKHAGIRQAIADLDETEVIFESTANGIGNVFHSEWKAAERSDSAFEPIFIPWYWHEEYETAPLDGWELPQAFSDYERAYCLRRPQTYWAWLKNREMAIVSGGDSDEPCWQFRQEYPANADEAFQTSGAETFIGAVKVLKARKATVDGYGPIVLGIDPARGGSDKTGIIDRQGRRLGARVCKRVNRDDLMALAGDVQQLVREINPAKVVVDITGLGAGLYDRLRELLGNIVVGVNFAATACNQDRYANRRAEMWDLMRQWFDDPAGVQVPDTDEFQGDLTAAVRGPGATRFDSNGRLILEAKEHIRERLTFSPDLGDAAALTFAVNLSTHQSVSRGPRVDPLSGGWLAM